MTDHLNSVEARQYVKQPTHSMPIFPLGEILQPLPGPSSPNLKRRAEEVLTNPRGRQPTPYIIPKDSKSARKYSKKILGQKKLFKYSNFVELVPKQMQTEKWFHTFQKLNSSAITRGTWGKYCSAMEKLKKYAQEVQVTVRWPLAERELHGFTLWCLQKEKLASDTVKTYIYGISHIQKLYGCTGISVANSAIIPQLLRGASNRRKNKRTPKVRDPVTFARLKTIRVAITNSR
jgi:hypothetical protein